MLALAKQKARPPNSACTGAPIEMICEGGEVAFVSKLIQESKLSYNKTRLQWFSSMLGKLGSVSTIAQRLKDVGCTNYAITEFIQGQKTRRWCVAWSWMNFRPAQNVARGTDAVDKVYLPFPTELDIPLELPLQTIVERITQAISQLERMEWRWNSKLMVGVGRSLDGNVWSRHARRKQKKSVIDADDEAMDTDSSRVKAAANTTSKQQDDEDDDTTTFGFKILSTSNVSTNACTITVRWLQGNDCVVFESFHGWLRRKLVG